MIAKYKRNIWLVIEAFNLLRMFRVGGTELFKNVMQIINFREAGLYETLHKAIQKMYRGNYNCMEGGGRGTEKGGGDHFVNGFFFRVCYWCGFVFHRFPPQSIDRNGLEKEFLCCCENKDVLLLQRVGTLVAESIELPSQSEIISVCTSHSVFVWRAKIKYFTSLSITTHFIIWILFVWKRKAISSRKFYYLLFAEYFIYCDLI